MATHTHLAIACAQGVAVRAQAQTRDRGFAEGILGLAHHTGGHERRQPGLRHQADFRACRPVGVVATVLQALADAAGLHVALGFDVAHAVRTGRRQIRPADRLVQVGGHRIPVRAQSARRRRDVRTVLAGGHGRTDDGAGVAHRQIHAEGGGLLGVIGRIETATAQIAVQVAALHPGGQRGGIGQVGQAVGGDTCVVERRLEAQRTLDAVHLAGQGRQRCSNLRIGCCNQRTGGADQAAQVVGVARGDPRIQHLDQRVGLVRTVDHRLRRTGRLCAGRGGIAGQGRGDGGRVVRQCRGPEEIVGVLHAVERALQDARLDDLLGAADGVAGRLRQQQQIALQAGLAGDGEAFAQFDGRGAGRVDQAVVAVDDTAARFEGGRIGHQKIRTQAAGERQHAILNRGAAAIGIGAAQGELACAALGQAARAGDVVAEGAVVASGHIGRPVACELARALDRLGRIDQAPAVQRVHARVAQVGGGGQQGLLQVGSAHPRIHAQHLRSDTADGGGGERGAGNLALQFGAGQGRGGIAARRDQAPLRSGAAMIGIAGQAGGIAGAIDIDRTDGQPVVAHAGFLHRRCGRVGGFCRPFVASGGHDQRIGLHQRGQCVLPGQRSVGTGGGIGVGGTDGKVGDPHAGRGQVHRRATGLLRAAGIFGADARVEQVRIRRDATGKAVLRGAQHQRRHNRAMAAQGIGRRFGRARAGGVIVEAVDLAADRRVARHQVVVQHRQLHALATRASLLRQIRIGRHQQIAAHALVAWRGRRRCGCGRGQRIRCRRRGRRCRCDHGGLRRVATDVAATATAAAGGQDEARGDGGCE